jgi:hypothetical protein
MVLSLSHKWGSLFPRMKAPVFLLAAVCAMPLRRSTDWAGDRSVLKEFPFRRL